MERTEQEYKKKLSDLQLFVLKEIILEKNTIKENRLGIIYYFFTH